MREKRVEVAVESARLVDDRVGGVERRIDRAVEHHRPHVPRKLLRVEGADLGPVREPDVAQLLLAHRGADRVEVVHGRVG